MNKCSCGKHLKPVAVVAGEKFYYTCDICLEDICDNCAIVDEDTGTVICMNCYQDKKRKEN